MLYENDLYTFKIIIMKKTFICSFLFTVCFIFFTSCSKGVKAPAKVSNATSTVTYTGTIQQTSNQNQTSHTCPGSSDNSDGVH